MIYTLESIHRHPHIDAIEIVCIVVWHYILWAYVKQFNIDKLKWTVSGGKSGQESIRNGVFNLEEKVNGLELPEEVEAAGYSKVIKTRSDITKLKGLGWKAK